MVFISSTIILLIQSFAIIGSTPGPLPATWRKYIDKVGTTCIASQAHGVLEKVAYLRVDYQRTNLHCVSPNTFFSINDWGIIDQYKPCGFIHHSNRVDHHQHQRWWTITVHQQFYMNLTVLEFALSMPYGKCELD